MTTETVEGVMDPTAMAILCDLKRDGFRVELVPDDAIVITPKSRLTPDRRQQVIDHKAGIKALLRRLDIGVQDRLDEFRRQLAVVPAPRCPAFLFRSDVSYVRGVCFSCGDALPEPRFGRCWRCSVAWRLCCRLAVSADLAAALDSARVA